MTSFFFSGPMRRIKACLTLLALLTPVSALAQVTGGAVSVTNGPPLERTTPIGHNNRIAISHADCVKDGTFTYRVSLAGVSTGDLQVWVGGANCEPLEARQGNTQQCWLIYSTPAANMLFTPQLRVQDIVANATTSKGLIHATSAVCEQTTFGSTGPQSLSLHFLVIDSSQQVVAGSGAIAKVEADLIGPPAPTNVRAGIGEERLVLKWDAPLANDRLGHRFYCDPKPGPVTTTMQADGGVGPDTGTDATTDGPAPDAGVGGAAGAGGASDGGNLTDSGTGDGSGGNPSCPSTALVPGKRPNEANFCGEVGKTAGQGEAKGLVNYQLYAVGVAGFDELGNPGPLSPIACGTPQEVNDFFEVYRRAGGEGGGGFCSFGTQPVYGGGVFLALAAVARWLRRRRP